MSYPWFCAISLHFSSRFILLVSSLPISLLTIFYRFFVVIPRPIKIFLPLTDPSHFTISTKFYFTLNSFPLLRFSARCLLSSFFFSLDIPTLSLRCHVRNLAPSFQFYPPHRSRPTSSTIFPDASFGLIRNKNDSVRFRVNAKSVFESFGIQSV